MKKMSIFFAAVFLFLATPIANADSDDYKKFFIGAGASYGIENFKEGNFDDTWGINAKIGYHPYDIFAVQLEYDYLSEFKDNDFLNGDVELEIMTYMLSLKGNFPVKWYNVISPFIVVGGGVMHADADANNISIAGTSYDFSGSETDLCGKIGGGFDFYLAENFSLNLEGNYTVGGNDLEDIRYFHFILGGVFRFNLPTGNHEF